MRSKVTFWRFVFRGYHGRRTWRRCWRAGGHRLYGDGSKLDSVRRRATAFAPGDVRLLELLPMPGRLPRYRLLLVLHQTARVSQCHVQLESVPRALRPTDSQRTTRVFYVLGKVRSVSWLLSSIFAPLCSSVLDLFNHPVSMIQFQWSSFNNPISMIQLQSSMFAVPG